MFAIDSRREFAIMRAMMTQDEIRTWIVTKLAQKGRGSRTALANHLGLKPDAITRMLNREAGKESREIRAAEWESIKVFFKEDPDRDAEVSELLEAYGQLDPDLRPVALQRIRSLIAAKS